MHRLVPLQLEGKAIFNTLLIGTLFFSWHLIFQLKRRASGKQCVGCASGVSEKSYFPALALHRVSTFVSDGVNSQFQSELHGEKVTFWVYWTIPTDVYWKIHRYHRYTVQRFPSPILKADQSLLAFACWALPSLYSSLGRLHPKNKQLTSLCLPDLISAAQQLWMEIDSLIDLVAHPHTPSQDVFQCYRGKTGHDGNVSSEHEETKQFLAWAYWGVTAWVGTLPRCCTNGRALPRNSGFILDTRFSTMSWVQICSYSISMLLSALFYLLIHSRTELLVVINNYMGYPKMLGSIKFITFIIVGDTSKLVQIRRVQSWSL